MKINKLTITAFALLSLTTSAFSTNIYFDDFTVSGGVSTAAADRYRSDGAVFNQGILIENLPVAEPDQLTAWLATGATAPNEMILTPANGWTMNMSFVVPGTATPTTTDHVQALFLDSDVGTTLGTLEAFDINNQLLASSTMTTPASTGGTLSVSVAGIAWVRFSTDSDNCGVDNISFTPVPEPSSGSLLLGGMAVFVLAARRIKAGKQQVPVANQ